MSVKRPIFKGLSTTLSNILPPSVKCRILTIQLTVVCVGFIRPPNPQVPNVKNGMGLLVFVQTISGSLSFKVPLTTAPMASREKSNEFIRA